MKDCIWQILWTMALMFGGGCVSPIPTYPWEGPVKALEQLRSESSRIKSFSGECEMVLRRADTLPVRLRGAVAVRMPEYVRMRAWKFQTPVLDFTSKPDGMWLWVKQEAGQQLALPESKKENSSVPSIWTPGGAAWLHDTDSKIVDHEGDEFEVHHHPKGTSGVRLVAGIDRSTRTVRRYELWIKDRLAHRLILADHRLFPLGPWPTKWTFESTGRVMEIQLIDFEFNPNLPDAAFKPARGARKIQ